MLSVTEMRERLTGLRALQSPCQLCPRRCGVDRRSQAGRCAQPLALQVAAVCAHGGEEPPISGESGAGTVFVAGCTMQCCFCQNHQISQPAGLQPGWATDPARLASRLLELQRGGCHNVEWVSPTQHLPALLEALCLAREQGLALPLVFNCNGFHRVEVLRLLEGIVDVYLPDAKYSDDGLARELSATDDYVEINRRALVEMQRQVGPLVLDPGSGLARRGLLVRHLVLPGAIENTRGVLRWIAGALGTGTWVSLMAQYYPAHRAAGRDPLHRRLSPREYRRAVAALDASGLVNGWVQERATGTLYRPDFLRARPFEGAPLSTARDR